MDKDQDLGNGYQASMMEIYILDIIKRIENREKENIFGLQAVFSKEIFWEI